MAADDAPDDDNNNPTLSKSMVKLFASGEYSDMIIKCGDAVHAVHRAIVCSQSSFFANAMKKGHNFKEAQTNTVELDHDHPATIKALLEFMYLTEYSDLGFGDTVEDRVLLHIDVYATADKYGIGGLRKHSTANIEEIVNSEDWTVVKKALPKSISSTYEKTLENDKVLRLLMIRIVSKDIDRLVDETEFLRLTDDVEGFNTELLQSLVTTNKRLKIEASRLARYRCTGCNEAVNMFLLNESVTYSDGWDMAYETFCPRCGACFANRHWKCNSIT